MSADLLPLAIVLVLLVVSGFFSGSETAVTGASRSRMRTLAQQGVRRAQTVERLWDSRERMIGSILIGNNLANILASTLSASLFISWFGDAGIAYATVIMTVLVVIFSEVLPKTYAIHHSDRVALLVAPILRVLVLVLAPLTKALNWLVRGSLGLVGVQFDAGEVQREEREEELRGAIDLHASGEIAQERAMLRSILDLADVEVSEIMTHRSDVVAIDADLPAEEIVRQVLESPYTRIPLWRGEPDNIVGVLHAKSLLRAIHAEAGGGPSVDVMAVAQSPWFIPDSTDLLAQLEAFRQRHEHFALVVDEYGVFMGIVTLEDILEEIVGEIADEYDSEIEGVSEDPAGGYVIDGRVTLRDLNRRYDWSLPDEDASTIAGLVLYETRTIPGPGQTFALHGFMIEILERERHQITKLKVTPISESPLQANPPEAGAQPPA